MKFGYFLTFLILFSLALADEKKKESLTFEKWTPGFEVPDPVAISFDPRGRAYVTQTLRRKSQDLDIRQNLDWVIQDLSSQSIEDKENFYRREFTREKSLANQHRVKDWNGDDYHDIADLQVFSERIHLVQDSDEDGLADKISLYAEKMDEILTGVAGGVLVHQGEVFACPVPELIRFRDNDGDDVADQKDGLVRGFGLKIAYAGHDMHGLIVGPDGRIYWTVGDKGLSVLSKEGVKFHFPDRGALMRCEPDGSNFEVYAHGLRNIQEIAFDKYGNFFGVDNDADGKGERERFVHVEQYSDTGWRSNWQYRKEKYNPWMDENMHIPYFEGQAAWFSPPRSNYENGPAGFKYNPGTALSPAYEDHFFLTSAPQGDQWAFQIEPDDDSFKMVNDRKIGSGIAVVGLCFGPDGGLYGADWGVTDYTMDQKGGIWRVDVPETEKHPLRKFTQELIAADFSNVDTSELALLISHNDQRVRLKTQFELVKRKEISVLQELSALGKGLGSIHAIWGLGQLDRQGVDVTSALLNCLRAEDPEIQRQALRTLTDRHGVRLACYEVAAPSEARVGYADQIVPLLKSPSIQVRVQALLALARIGDTSTAPVIMEYLNHPSHQLSQTMLRHGGAMALAGCVPTAALAPQPGDTQFFAVCKVLALRKRRDPAVAGYLSSPDPIIAAEAAQAIYGDWMIPDALPALAESLGKHPENKAFTVRAIAANFNLGKETEAARVVDFLKGNPAPYDAALHALEQWTEPGPLDPVEGRYRPMAPRDPQILSQALSPRIKELLASKNTQIGARSMKLATKLGIPLEEASLLVIAKSDTAPADMKAAALVSLQAQNHGGTWELAANFVKQKSSELQISALGVMTQIDKVRAVVVIEDILKKREKIAIPVRQFAIRLLPETGGDALLKAEWETVTSGTVEPAEALDIIESAKKVPALAPEVAAYEAALMAKSITEPLAAFVYTKTGGDAKKGQQIFNHHVAAECQRCHKVAPGPGSNVGPILAGLGKKKGIDYLLESLVNPQAQVTKGYGTISVTLQDGTNLTGQFLEETKKDVMIRAPDGKSTRVKLGDIKERSPVISIMPPMGYILKKEEVRDIMAYLMSI